jgi:hypothetical protein
VEKYSNNMRMSKLISIAMVFVCGVFYFSLSHADMNVIGKWSGIDSDGDTATFVFNEDNSAELKLEGVPLLSSANLVHGSVEWVTNTDYDPIHLDIVILIDSAEKQQIPMVARFVDDQTLRILISRDMKSRPKGFAINKDVFQVLAKKQ